MRKLLHSAKINIVKEAAWTISNITAGNAGQIQTVIDAGLFSDICEVLQGSDYRSQKEAAWVVTNVTSSGTEQQILYLIEHVGILKPFCELMKIKDPRGILVILSGLKNLFALADKRGFLEKFATAFEAIGALDLLDALQQHENIEVYQQAVSMIELYFSDVSDVVQMKWILVFRRFFISIVIISWSLFLINVVVFSHFRILRLKIWHPKMLELRSSSTQTT